MRKWLVRSSLAAGARLADIDWPCCVVRCELFGYSVVLYHLYNARFHRVAPCCYALPVAFNAARAASLRKLRGRTLAGVKGCT